MATTGLEVFDRTLHTTNLWLDEITGEIGPDRHLAWHVLGAVLRSIRDEMQVEQSAHFAAQLPLLIRGAYFDQYRPAVQPLSARSLDEFIARIEVDLDGSRPVRAEQAAMAVMRTLNRHVTEGQLMKVRDALPKGVRAMWPEPDHPEHKKPGHAGSDLQKSDQSAKTDQGAKGAEPARSAGQAGQPGPGGQRAPQPPAEPQHAAPQPPAQQRTAPPPSPPQHAAPQTSLHPAPKRPAREWEEIDIAEEIDMIDMDEGDTSSIAGPSSSKDAHAPIGAAGRPAGIHAAPATERTTSSRKTKTRAKRG